MGKVYGPAPGTCFLPSPSLPSVFLTDFSSEPSSSSCSISYSRYSRGTLNHLLWCFCITSAPDVLLVCYTLCTCLPHSCTAHILPKFSAALNTFLAFSLVLSPLAPLHHPPPLHPCTILSGTLASPSSTLLPSSPTLLHNPLLHSCITLSCTLASHSPVLLHPRLLQPCITLSCTFASISLALLHYLLLQFCTTLCCTLAPSSPAPLHQHLLNTCTILYCIIASSSPASFPHPFCTLAPFSHTC
jgi:hypothetical protein